MNRLGAAAAAIGFLTVAIGAFGAHALKGLLTAEGQAWFHTATLYALPHAVAALAVALSARSGLLQSGGWLLALGALVFSGSLYAMALGAPRWLGAITPLGGLALLAGWGLIALACLRRE